MNNIYIGIDQSLNSTGFVVIDDDYKIIKQEIISAKEFSESYEKIMVIGDLVIFNILKFSNEHKIKCCLEGISYGSQGKGVIQQGSLHNYIRINFKKYKIDHIVCPPTILKKFITGKGNCKKELMLMKIYKKWNIEFENSDLADAYALARYCKDCYNEITSN